VQNLELLKEMAINEYIERSKENEEEIIQPVEKKVKLKKVATPKNSKPNALTQILNGEFLTREFVLNNLSFIFFIIFLLLLIVGKGYYGKQLSKDVDKTQAELDEKNAEFIEAKARLEMMTRRFRLVKRLSPQGLKETQNNTKVIRIKKENK
jgi:cell division protein FtsL